MELLAQATVCKVLVSRSLASNAYVEIFYVLSPILVLACYRLNLGIHIIHDILNLANLTLHSAARSLNLRVIGRR